MGDIMAARYFGMSKLRRDEARRLHRAAYFRVIILRPALHAGAGRARRNEFRLRRFLDAPCLDAHADAAFDRR